MSQYRGIKLRQRDVSTFDPTDRQSQMIGWWQAERGVVSSGGVFTSLTDLSGKGHNGVCPFNVPTIVSSDSTMGNKTTLQFTRGGTSQGIYIHGPALTMPFTIYMAGYMGPDQGVFQCLLMGNEGAVVNYPKLWTASASPADILYQNGTNQLNTGLVIANQPFFLSTVWNTSGSQSGVSKNSETLDVQGDLGSLGASGFLIGTDSGYSQNCTMRFAELIIFTGIDTHAQRRDLLGYFQGRYAQPLDYDPPGALYREKMAVTLYASPGSYVDRTISPLVTPNGALRLHTRVTPASQNSGRDQMWWAQHNSGAGPELHQTSDGRLTVTNNSVSYSTELGVLQDLNTDVDIFCAVGGGVAPELAWRVDGPGGAWIPLPLVSGAATPAITASGNIHFGGDPSGTTLASTFKEIVAFTDGAGPAGYLKKTYPAGVIAILDGLHGTTFESGGWPGLALASLTKAYPKPRMPGSNIFQTYEGLNTAVSTYTGMVVGGSTLNVAFIAGGAYGSIISGGDSAATAYAALQTLCTSLRSGGFNKIIVPTVCPAASLNDTTRLALNVLIKDPTTGLVAGGYADVLCDWAANATIGATGAYSNTTYYSDNRGWTLAGGRIAASIAATALNAILP